MSTESLLIAIAGGGLPKGETKREMFNFHNSMIGKSIYFGRNENPKTACGSCIQRVKTAIWKWYHLDETSPKFDRLVFLDRLGAHNIPLYTVRDAN
tara:strand:- start:355 stop:642 length:288 start_codon:yes stop_codon:yes gene_type:complete